MFPRAGFFLSAALSGGIYVNIYGVYIHGNLEESPEYAPDSA